MPFDTRAATAVTRMGLGLAALGRPAYITLGRDADLPAGRSVEAMRTRTHEVLDAAHAAGVRYVDAARSYGRAEEFLAEWLRERPGAADVVVGSKWGYTYTGDWRMDAPAQEVKDHSAATFTRQLAETRQLLGDRLDLYQIHSLTPDSPVLTDRPLQERLAALVAEGVSVGVSTSGPRQADAVRAALDISVAGVPLFTSVQATYNLLEPSVGPALAEARAAGRTVIVKEALANGRLAHETDRPLLTRLAAQAECSPAALALAAVLHEEWAGLVLSGAVTTDQLADNLSATHVRLDGEAREQLATLAEPAEAYWRDRGSLPWS
ncbi:aldo/keto reductase [Actinopolymorpha pittospori]